MSKESRAAAVAHCPPGARSALGHLYRYVDELREAAYLLETNANWTVANHGGEWDSEKDSLRLHALLIKLLEQTGLQMINSASEYALCDACGKSYQDGNCCDGGVKSCTVAEYLGRLPG